MAAAIHRGIREWFKAHPPSGTLLAWQKQQGAPSRPQQGVARSATSGGQQQYIIASGDTLSGIADRFSVPLSDLKSHNRIDGSKILVGQKLTIPKSS